jgi:hypothetical protein
MRVKGMMMEGGTDPTEGNPEEEVSGGEDGGETLSDTFQEKTKSED